MAVTKFSNPPKEVLTGKDNVVIPQFISGISGGRTLDTTGFPEAVIPAGLVVITDGNGAYKPMPVSEGAYGTLPANHSYAGVVACSVLASKPAVSIMTAGQVNESASPYPVTSISAAIKAALPGIQFIKEEYA